MSNPISNRQRTEAARDVARLLGFNRRLTDAENRRLANSFRLAHASLTR